MLEPYTDDGFLMTETYHIRSFDMERADWQRDAVSRRQEKCIQVHKLLLQDKRRPRLQVLRSQYGTSAPIGSIPGHQFSGR